MGVIARVKLIETAVSQFGKPYKFGAKWDTENPSPDGPIDCSGFVRWCYKQGAGILLPDGSTNQHSACEKLPDNCGPSFGDLSFLQDLNKDPDVGDPGAEDHHVGMVYDGKLMIEARGHFTDTPDGRDIGWSVLLRPRTEWEARPDFLGYFRPKAVLAIEGHF